MPLVKRNRPNVLQVLASTLGGKGVTIYPGITSLTDEPYKACQTNRGFRSCMENGSMELVAEGKPSAKKQTKGGDGAGAQNTMSGIEMIQGKSVKDAAPIIAEILNTKDLEAIRENDQRKGIQDAVDAQLEKLKIDDADKKDEDK